MRFSALAFAAACFALAACGESDEDKASDAAVAFMEAMGDVDTEEACDLLTEDKYTQLGGDENCTNLLRGLVSEFAVEFPEATNVSLEGDTGQVEIEGSGDQTVVVDVAKDGDEWRVEEVIPTG